MQCLCKGGLHYDAPSKGDYGICRMVLIARALIKEPELLIMDEPETGLDMKNQMIVLETIEALSRNNLSIIINTHYPDHALRCADKTLLLGKNRLYMQ